MDIAFFAARRLQRDYFIKIAAQLEKSGTKSHVFWHKALWLQFSWVIGLCSTPSHDLSNIVKDALREKANSRKYQKKPDYWWKLFYILRFFEAFILLAIYRNTLKRTRPSLLIIWNGLKFRQRIVSAAAHSLGIKTAFMENGLLPSMTTLDQSGVNYLNSVPRSSKELINASEKITPEKTSKNDNIRFSTKPPGLPENYIFAPFQVDTDSQIILFSPWLSSMLELCEALKKAEKRLGENMPHIVLKTHPACNTSYSELSENLNKSSSKIQLLLEGDTASLIEHSSAVATINSTVGIESLLANKPLLVLGEAFYNIPEIALSALSQSELEHNLSLISSFKPDEKTRQALLNYLKYIYQIPGHWQDANEEHLKAVAQALKSIIDDGSYCG